MPGERRINPPCCIASPIQGANHGGFAAARRPNEETCASPKTTQTCRNHAIFDAHYSVCRHLDAGAPVTRLTEPRLHPMRIAQISPLFEAVPPKLYGGTERVVYSL